MNIGGRRSTRVTTGWLSPQDDSGQHLNIFVYCRIFTYCQISRDSVLEESLEKRGGVGGGWLRCLNDAHNVWQAIRTEKTKYSHFHKVISHNYIDDIGICDGLVRNSNRTTVCWCGKTRRIYMAKFCLSSLFCRETFLTHSAYSF